MATATAKRVLIVAGLGVGGGTGGGTARLFAKQGYAVALVARGGDSLNKLAGEIKENGGEAVAFPIQSYGASHVADAFKSIKSAFPAPKYAIKVALYNASFGVWKPFLQVTPDDIKSSTEVNIEGSFAFSKEVIEIFKTNDIEPDPTDADTGALEGSGKRGTLIFTGATASLRGNTTTSVFAAGKFALRALSQSLAKEFGKEGIHVAHAIIDGSILTSQGKDRRKDPEWEKNQDVRLTPEGIAKSYLYLVNQDRSNWTWELDLRPAHEKW